MRILIDNLLQLVLLSQFYDINNVLLRHTLLFFSLTCVWDTMVLVWFTQLRKIGFQIF